ncbi:MAG: hypothetical protein PHF37_08125 [Phycisphaerae bacterium]|nr:hypothetical protein [Phycisphaerae bacterium]
MTTNNTARGLIQRNRLLTAFFLLLFILTPKSWAQEQLNPGNLFSPSAAMRFYQIAHEYAHNENAKKAEVQQGLSFLSAASILDNRADYILPDIIDLATRYYEPDNSQLVHQILSSYLNESADMKVVVRAVQYILDQQNTREKREQVLIDMAQRLGPRNSAFASQIYTLLGLLAAEIADTEKASGYFMQAYISNKYNQLAFEKLAEIMPEQINVIAYIEYLRRGLVKNPLDMEKAIQLGEYLRQLSLYPQAGGVYDYCVEVYDYLYPAKPVPDWLYLPWAMSYYNNDRNEYKCLQIAKRVRESGRFDIVLQAIEGNAAAKLGDVEKARTVLEETAAQAEKKLTENFNPAAAQQLAWFYSFVLIKEQKAIEWANQVYAAEPNSTTTADILGYALILNGQTDLASSLVSDSNSQIDLLTRARLKLAGEDKTEGLKLLKKAIEVASGTLEAETARQLLKEIGGEYIPPLTEEIETALQNEFGTKIIPEFIKSQDMYGVQLNIKGSSFPYGSDFGANLSISNKWSEPLIISQEAVIKGHIRVDAQVSGDLSETIELLIDKQIEPSQPIEPAKSLLVPLQLNTGRLDDILMRHPQANLTIEFKVYLDPMLSSTGKLVNGVGTEPQAIMVSRPAVDLSGKFLQNRLNEMAKARSGQKISIGQLFTGLLLEQQMMAGNEPQYKFMYADWMLPLLKSALVSNLRADEWVVRTQTVCDLLKLPLDDEFADAMGANIQDSQWPVRLATIYVLSKKQGDNFNKVLDWVAQYDKNQLVRNIAIELGGKQPAQPQQQTPAASEQLD